MPTPIIDTSLASDSATSWNVEELTPVIDADCLESPGGPTEAVRKELQNRDSPCRSSKSARSRSPRLARFGSGAAPPSPFRPVQADHRLCGGVGCCGSIFRPRPP